MNKVYSSYGRQWITPDDINEVVRVLKSDWLTQGPKVNEFEEKVASYCGARFAVAVSNGTAALHLAALAAGVTRGDEVITSPITFVASANCAVYCGARPVFADIAPDTRNIDAEKVERAITKKTKAIVPVDFAGHPCDLDEVRRLAKRHKLLVIEDASHALGARYKGRRVGALADMTTFSFHPVKHITTAEGGMILTDSEELEKQLRILRNHGITRENVNPAHGPWYYEMRSLGFNYRLSDVQSALGISQLKRINRIVSIRRMLAGRYRERLKGIKELTLPAEREYVKSSYHLFVITLNLEDLKTGRKKIFEEFRKKGLGVQVHYIPVHLQPYYRKRFGYRKGDYPVAEDYYKRAVTLPLHPGMKERDVDKVAGLVKEVINNYTKL